MSAKSNALFQPVSVGSINLSHRVALAPLTRYRADDQHVPLPFVVDYYSQRASTPGTLLITEGTFISPRASGNRNVPGLWTSEQLSAWKEVTDAVHAKGSFIYCQLWALGRAAEKEVFDEEFPGTSVASSSTIPIPGSKNMPKELREEEIWDFVEDYKTAARRAVEEGGFDGVEIHGANGYLVDQFIQDNSNKRTDAWGGSVENRSRFAIEVAKATASAVGPERVGIRLSPFSKFQGMRMEDPIPQFTHVIQELRKLDLAYVHLIEGRISGNTDVECGDELDFALDAWGDRPVVLAGGFKPDTALRALEEKYRDKPVVIAFGRLFISNPDLPFRIKRGLDLEPYNRKTFYLHKSKEGYVDYPFSEEFEGSKL